MKLLKHTLFAAFALFLVIPVLAQDIVAKEGSYGVDAKNKIIVWHVNDLDSLLTANSEIKNIKFNESFIFKANSKALSYLENTTITNGEDYTLYITKLPIVSIQFDMSKIKKSAKIPGYFTFFKGGEYIKNIMGIRHRGNLSLTFAKKSFDIEFWKDSTTKTKKNIKFKDMRNDDDWILDGMFNEPLRLRSYVATTLWSKIHKPYYLDKEPKAQNGFDVKYVEVFKNGSYYGLYQLSESVDRKQLQIKKNEENNIHGELYKANSYDGGPAFEKSPNDYNNLFPHWNGWKTEYPFIDYKSDWENLFKFSNLVVNAKDEVFSSEIEKQVNITNVIDYYLFINTVRATDNLGKNYYLGKYDKNEPYFFVAWDLDGVMGIIQDGKRETHRKDILANGLFNRLIDVNSNNYKEKLKARWLALRETEFSNDALLSRVNKIYNKFTKEKVYEREQLVWQNKLNELSNQEHYDYLKTWLNERLKVLDAHFKTL